MMYERMTMLELRRRMYSAVCDGANQALTLLEDGNVWDAKRVLRQVLEEAEELYLTHGPEETED